MYSSYDRQAAPFFDSMNLQAKAAIEIDKFMHLGH